MAWAKFTNYFEESEYAEKALWRGTVENFLKMLNSKLAQIENKVSNDVKIYFENAWLTIPELESIRRAL